jgi:hypothetical protein
LVASSLQAFLLKLCMHFSPVHAACPAYVSCKSKEKCTHFRQNPTGRGLLEEEVSQNTLLNGSSGCVSLTESCEHGNGLLEFHRGPIFLTVRVPIRARGYTIRSSSLTNDDIISNMF